MPHKEGSLSCLLLEAQLQTDIYLFPINPDFDSGNKKEPLCLEEIRQGQSISFSLQGAQFRIMNTHKLDCPVLH